MSWHPVQDGKVRQSFVTAATMAKVVAIATTLYTEHVPSQLRAEMLTPLVSIMGRCSLRRKTRPVPACWAVLPLFSSSHSQRHRVVLV